MTSYQLTPPVTFPSRAVQEAKEKRCKALETAERTRKANYQRFLQRMAYLQKTLREDIDLYDGGSSQLLMNQG